MPSSDDSLLVGSWALWGFGLMTTMFRLLSRRMFLGSFGKFQLDDYLMLLATVTMTGVIVSSNQVAANGSNYVPDEIVEQWSPEQVERAKLGSKMLVVLEELMLATIWLVKACLLLFYARLSNGLKEKWAVKAVAVYCAIGYIIVQILYLGVWCRPIYYYWAVPVPPGHPQCKSYHNHMITVTTLNISSDLAILSIPVPLIARAMLPLRRKLVLCTVFSLGVFMVLVAVLNRYYNFSTPYSLVFLVWYDAEAATAVMIANVPFCWTLLRRVFSLDAWGGGSSRRSRATSGPPTIGQAGQRRRGRIPLSSLAGAESCDSFKRGAAKRPGHESPYELGELGPVKGDCGGRSQESDPEAGTGQDY